MDLAGLADKRAYVQVLGSIIISPLLLSDADRPLTKSDFDTELFYKYIFVSVYNLYQQGVEKIDEYTIDSYLSNYPEQYKVFQENNGLTWIADATGMTEVGNYDYWYHRVKKFSLLRYYEKNGLDTRVIFDGNKIDATEENQRFDNLTEQEIVDFIESKYVLVPKSDYCGSQSIHSIQAGQGLAELIDEYLIAPDYGFPMTSLAANTLCRGLRRGKLYIRSAGTGSGKSRTFLMDACTLAVPYTYDIDKKEYVYTGHSTPTLFIGTEMSNREFQTIVAATVSGVDERHIIMGSYEEGELERVRQAEKYISDSPLELVYTDDFTISEIENLVKKYVIQKGIEVLIFDYIQTTPRLISEMNNKSSFKMQEYQILIQFAGRLKALAENTNIAILTGSQLRPDSKDMRFKDETTLQGAKAISQKVDIGMTLSKLSPSEKQKVEKITRNMWNCPEVNRLVWYWKIRQGALTSIIVACHLDLSNMRMKDLFVMDYDFNLINIDFTKIEEVNEVIKEQSRELKVEGDEEDEDEAESTGEVKDSNKFNF